MYRAENRTRVGVSFVRVPAYRCRRRRGFSRRPADRVTAASECARLPPDCTARRKVMRLSLYVRRDQRHIISILRGRSSDGRQLNDMVVTKSKLKQMPLDCVEAPSLTYTDSRKVLLDSIQFDRGNNPSQYIYAYTIYICVLKSSNACEK
ncbi:hypothetical protein EVAR_16496_1 [Eumeta japonica]|uniref:Uncharacterized protein n=1 Tax=Eumeta variegata TaxID=151549 RepID=A0A4C1UM21_EUMVA|nr:hypothetical protein EVAR_16496_1 [Eumeta japonica]